jgi:SAM-dependent methyltransferase
MIQASTVEQERLERLVDQIMQRHIGDLGWTKERTEEIRPKATAPDAQDFLFAAIEHTISVPGYFQTPRRILDVGCGTAALVYSALARGHDAYGVDLDRDRLAVAHAKIPVFGFDSQWAERVMYCDASATSFESKFFDLVVGHQFIEHVSEVPATLTELLRVTRPGGFVVLYAPDYRAPFEAHYEMPWPLFPTRSMEQRWVEAFDRPVVALGTFNYVTAPQVANVLAVIGGDIVAATIDRPIDANAIAMFDMSSESALFESAKKVRGAWERSALPDHFRAATSFAVAVRKR